MDKQRIDTLLVQRGLIDSREKARAIIMAGQVFVNEDKVDKPGTNVNIDCNIEIKETLKYVSRGGYKLEKAISSFGIDLKDKICIDIGASTGGFTDCMLQNGGAKVYAIDVGYGQLSWNLRQDSRVVVMERTNIRYVKPEDLSDKCHFASIDVSFISITKILNAVEGLLTNEGKVVCLIKPQFEAGREKVGKKGVVRDKDTHFEVIKKVIEYANAIGFGLLGLTFSPIKGPEGNIEYLAYLGLTNENIDLDIGLINKTVQDSHESLNN